jgi:putative ABC transport system substrate-binding protein
MISRREILAGLTLSVVAVPLAAYSQQSQVRLARIGFLGAVSAPQYTPRIEAFRTGLRQLGYSEGRNIVIDFRWADSNYKKLDELAAELVKLRVDVIVTHGTPGTLAAQRATTAIPIVMTVSGDAVATGIVATMARPGGNVTGSTFFSPDLTAKRLEMMKEAIPRIKRVGVLTNPGNRLREPALKAAAIVAKALNLTIQSMDAGTLEDIEAGFAAAMKNHIEAVVLADDGFFVANGKAIADIAIKHRVPTIGSDPEFVDAGGLMYYGVNQLDMWRRAAAFVDKIIKGASPAELPIEQATTFEMAINLNAAQTIGVPIPKAVMLRADRIIE